MLCSEIMLKMPFLMISNYHVSRSVRNAQQPRGYSGWVTVVVVATRSHRLTTKRFPPSRFPTSPHTLHILRQSLNFHFSLIQNFTSSSFPIKLHNDTFSDSNELYSHFRLKCWVRYQHSRHHEGSFAVAGRSDQYSLSDLKFLGDSHIFAERDIE